MMRPGIHPETCIGDCILGASWVESMRAVACASAQPAARVVKVSNGARRTMMRPGIHPEFFEEAPVYCNGCGTRDISPAILSRICDRCGPPLRPAPPARGTHTAPSAFLPRREQVLTVGGTKK